jgi:hypothetical protein
VNPLTVLTPSSQLEHDRILLANAAVTPAPPELDTQDYRQQLWDAKYRVDAVYHPDTGEVIPVPFRMSMFMPVNLPITAGMLLSPPVRALRLTG